MSSVWRSSGRPPFERNSRPSIQTAMPPPFQPKDVTTPACCQGPCQWWKPWLHWFLQITCFASRGSAVFGEATYPAVTGALPLLLTAAASALEADVRVRVRRDADFFVATAFFLTVRRARLTVPMLRWLSTRAHSSSERVAGLLPWA